MKIRRRDVGDVTILELSGNFSGGPDSYDFEHIIEQLIDEKCWNTVVNFKHVKWINSPGIGIMTRNYSHYVRFGGQIVVAELNTRVSILFEMMIRNIFEVYETEKEAVEVTKSRATAPPRQKSAAANT